MKVFIWLSLLLASVVFVSGDESQKTQIDAEFRQGIGGQWPIAETVQTNAISGFVTYTSDGTFVGCYTINEDKEHPVKSNGNWQIKDGILTMTSSAGKVQHKMIHA